MRIVVLWKLLSILREYLLVFGIAFSFARINNTEQLLNLVIFYADSIVVSWSCGILTCLFTSLSTSRAGQALVPSTIVTYPLLIELPYALIIRPISCIYSLTYYIFQRAPRSIRKQVELDSEKAEAIENAWN